MWLLAPGNFFTFSDIELIISSQDWNETSLIQHPHIRTLGHLHSSPRKVLCFGYKSERSSMMISGPPPFPLCSAFPLPFTTGLLSVKRQRTPPALPAHREWPTLCLLISGGIEVRGQEITGQRSHFVTGERKERWRDGLGASLLSYQWE